jgi:spore coat protein U-like protein
MKREARYAFSGCRNSSFRNPSHSARTLIVLLGLGLPALAPTAHAATATDNLSVSASVSQKCTVTATGVSFGAYDPVVTNASTALTGSGSLAVKCTKSSTGITIGLSAGANESGGARRMSDGGSNYLTYELYQPSATTPAATCSYSSPTVWNTSGGVFTPSGVTWSASTAATFNVCGSIAGGQDVAAAASYSDTVVATINF